MTNYLKEDVRNVDVVTSWNCKGKFIWFTLDKGKWNEGMDHVGEGMAKEIEDEDEENEEDFYRSIWVTLGMTGRFVREARMEEHVANNGNEATATGRTSKLPRWYLEFLDENESLNQNGSAPTTKKIYYHDTRNFGTLRFSLSKKELEEKLDSLGPDILTDDFTEQVFLGIVRNQRQELNVCKFLMDQSKISGVGNYLLSEALYRANLDPFCSLGDITDDQARTLYTTIKDTARASYESQGMTMKDGGSYRDLDGNKGKYTFELQCYGREYCPKGNQVIRETDGPHGRAIWYVKDQLLTTNRRRFGAMASLSQANQSKMSVGPNDEQMEKSLQKEDLGLTLSEALTDESWREALASFLNSETFDRLCRFVESERRLHTVYPLSQDVFSALNHCPLDHVKVVIIGQDPYHGPGQGHGLAFSVQKGIDPPPSLRNIFRELQADEGIRSPTHGNLESWARQGVLLINTVLTVRRGEANSHSKMGWEDFSDEVVRILNERREGIVFLLWGAPAAKKGKAIDLSKHTVITTSHPSPLGASKTDSPFLVST
jgi:uracil-DNA glycosylase